jgi:hypothetical protein
MRLENGIQWALIGKITALDEEPFMSCPAHGLLAFEAGVPEHDAGGAILDGDAGKGEIQVVHQPGKCIGLVLFGKGFVRIELEAKDAGFSNMTALTRIHPLGLAFSAGV